MTLGLTSSGAVKIKTDNGTTRAVNCACCVPPYPPCPEIYDAYIIISEAMFNALRAGGSVNASGGGSEYTGCSFSATASGIIGGGNCGSEAGVYYDSCTAGSGQTYQSYMTFAWEISKVGLEYRLSYGNNPGNLGIISGACYTNIMPPNNFCYTVGFFTSWESDTNGSGILTNVGTTTLTTSAGSLNFGIWNLDSSASAFLNINITPFS